MRKRKTIGEIIADMDDKRRQQEQLEAQQEEEAKENLGWIYRQLGVHQAQVRFNGFEADRTSDGIGIMVKRFGRTMCGLNVQKGGKVQLLNRIDGGSDEDFAEPDEALTRVCEILDADHRKRPNDTQDPFKDYERYEPSGRI